MEQPFLPAPTGDRYTIASGARHPRARATLRTWATACALVVCASVPARAHEAPAEPPLFAAADCIEVVDSAEQSALEIAYGVEFDDTALTMGDIPVPDAKTHQFFAFRGMLFAQGFGHELFAFEAGAPDPIPLPLWITIDDVKRAAAANDVASGTSFIAADVPDDAVLAGYAPLADRWLRITADDARVPITIAQAQQGVRWELAGVLPGLYTLAGYIFSPPYNGWAVRPGIVKVVAPGQDAPAAVIEPVHEILFAYQGRRVRACVSAPEDTLLHAWFSVRERPEQGWMPWLDSQAVASETLELCFRNPRPELSGSVRLRFDFEAPDGATTTVYSPDTLTALQGEGDCTPSDTLCCDGATPPPRGECARADARCDAGPESQTDGGAADAGSPTVASSGCALAAGAARSDPWPALAPLLPFVAMRRRRPC